MTRKAKNTDTNARTIARAISHALPHEAPNSPVTDRHAGPAELSSAALALLPVLTTSGTTPEKNHTARAPKAATKTAINATFAISIDGIVSILPSDNH